MGANEHHRVNYMLITFFVHFCSSISPSTNSILSSLVIVFLSWTEASGENAKRTELSHPSQRPTTNAVDDGE